MSDRPFGRRRVLLTMGGLGTAALLAACGPPTAESPAKPSERPADKPSEKPAEKPAAASSGGPSRITEGSFSDAQILNPVLSSDTSSGRIIDLMFNRLV